MENPWHIQSIYEMQYFICPCCGFKDHSKQQFINHTYENHPKSVEIFNSVSDKSLEDIVCPWNELTELMNIKQMKSKSKQSNELQG